MQRDIKIMTALAYIGLIVTSPLWAPFAVAGWVLDNARGRRCTRACNEGHTYRWPCVLRT